MASRDDCSLENHDQPRLIVAITSLPHADQAARLATALVEQRLAACAHLLPAGRSFYRWQGKLHDEPECILVIKSTPARFPEIERFISENHPYELPELIALESQRAAAAYARWVFSETSPLISPAD